MANLTASATTAAAVNTTTTQDILELEKLCEQMYNAQSPQQIHDANKLLEGFTQTSDCLNKCQIILNRGVTPYAQYIACILLTKALTRNTVILGSQDKYELRNYILNYLYTREKLANFVVNGLVQLFAKITKYGWFDTIKEQYIFQDIIQDITKFLQNTSERCVLGIRLLAELVNEMNHMDENEMQRSISKHRKISTSFRDLQLLEIFTVTCSLLKQAQNNLKSLNLNEPIQRELLTQLLQLSLNCLLYDFLGTSTDDTSDDLSIVQIPSTWRTLIMDFSNIDLYFYLYHVLPSDMASQCLACLVQLSAIRRSLFSNNERMKFLNELINGVKKILDTSSLLVVQSTNQTIATSTNGIGGGATQSANHLQDQKCYHEFCRLLARLKCNYQLSEFVKVDNYPEFINSIAKFTITSLRMYQFSSNSLYYLLSLWQRMIASVPYIKSQEPHLLETYTPEITKVYIQSRLELVNVVVRDGIEDPFDDLSNVYQQLEMVSIIGRCEYEKTCTVLVQLFDETAQQYQGLIQNRQNNVNLMEITIKEDQLTWLVYVIGGVIGGRLSYNTGNAEENDLCDGELVVRVLQLMNVINSRLEHGGCEKLDLALLNFFDQFRKIFVGDQMVKGSKVYRRMSELLGISDEIMWLDVVTRKIITNLKYWTRSERILNKTLNLLNDLSIGYSSVRKLMKLESIHFILANHTNEHFPFLGFLNQNTIKDMKCRTLFYTALGRLLNLDLNEDDDNFDQFMTPLSNQLDIIGNCMMSGGNIEEIKLPLVGLARDLRGLAFAFNSRISYLQLFDWIYPRYLQLFTKSIEIWFNESYVTTAILKLMSELVQNRSQRLIFDVSSPNGILLFREASKMVCAYGNRIAGYNVPKEQFYASKLKGISICFNILKWSLSGGYVNFGVFKLYSDMVLNNALQTFIKLIFCFTLNDLIVYQKLSTTYYGLLETLTSDHMPFISSLEPNVLLHILSTISEGISAIDTIISTSCCSALDHIVTHLYKQLTKKKRKKEATSNGTSNGLDDATTLIQVYRQQTHIFQQMLNNVLNIMLFEDCRNQWSMSRPLFALILLNEQYFEQWQNSFIQSQPSDRQESITHCMKNLMNGIEPNLNQKNRDKFTQNISLFRRDISNLIATNSASGSGSGGITGASSTTSISDMMS